MHIDSPVWQSCRQIEKIFRLLKGKARFVGGCVRDSLIGKPPNDIDLATPLKPPAVMGILKKHGFEVLPTGFLYGTVTVLTKDDRFPAVEITTLRRDISNDGRRPKVVYTKDWLEDSLRRDFTFNALYADFDGTVYDYCDGLQDLQNNRVRFIGEPAQRIAEDYLRILRYFRFLSLFGKSEADAETLEACRCAKKGLTKLSLDRTRRELFKLISVPNAVTGLSTMQQADILKEYFPLNDITVFDRLSHLRPNADLSSRLLALGGLTSEDVESLAKRWQLSKTELKKMRKTVLFDRSKKPSHYTDSDLLRLLVYFQKEDIDEILCLFEAGTPAEGWLELRERCHSFSLPPFRFSGSDIAASVPKSRIKHIVAQVREYWLTTNGQADRQDLLNRAAELIKR